MWRMKKDKSKNTRLLPNSFRIISSCIKTVSTNASTVVRSAGSSVAASISGSGDDQKDQVTWAGFDKLELATAAFRNVLLLGYQNGFQVIDAEDASNFSELVSKRDGPVTFLQILPVPLSSSGSGGFRSSHPLLLVVAGDEANGSSLSQNRGHMDGSRRDGSLESKSRNSVNSPMAVRFYSLSSKCYVQVIQFQSAVYMVRCSPLIVAVGLESQIYCIDALTLEKKTTIATYPIPHGGQGTFGVNVGYGPMAVGPRWLAYASVNPIVSNTGRLSPVNLIPAISPSSSPANGSLVARYAMESSKQLAAGIINLGDKGYRTIANSPVRFAAPETVHAGTVVVNDVASGVTLSQFKAHTSPISALCFDPSGTLLVTASVNGNNMNVFRIMPSIHSGSGNQSSDWSSSHVHLYKLHRGMTSAIIQDICFSHISQWVAIVSSKGTCHIFFLFPFGGHAGLQTFDSFGKHPAASPVLSLPWWSNSPIVLNQQSTPPPPPVTLSVVCRIKNNSSGLLNSVSNAAASAAGKVFVPSGAVAAVFHNSIPLSSENVHRRVNSLEHLLVYSPLGYVIQHQLLPSFGSEPSDIGSKSRSSSNLHTQDVDSTVTVKPVQCWDVCRRSDTPERDECIFVTASDGRETADMINNLNTNDSVGGEIFVKSNSIKSHERAYWFLSNAEVQQISCKLPIWQNTKIVFYMMSPPRAESLAGGEFEIEKVPCHEVEIKRKDLLPVYDPFHSISSDWNGRDLSGRYPPLILRSHHTRDKVTDETVICHSKPASLSSTESSDGGSSRRTESLLDLDQMNNEKCSHKLKEPSLEPRGCTVLEPFILDQKSTGTESYPSKYSKNKDFHAESNVLCDRRAVWISGDLPLVDTGGVSRVPVSTTSRCDSAVDILAEVQEKPAAAPSCVKRPVDIEHCFQEGYYNASEPDGCPPKSVKAAVTNVASGNDPYNGKKSDCDEEVLGGMFDFSEDGRDPNY